ncbi:MAG: ABC transporter ATP-binding protein [Desertimonas sp.]
MTEGQIHVDGVAKRFDTVEVLRDVTIRIGHGEIVTLLGPSGCGKTTLLRTIAGLERVDRGRVSIDGVVVGGDGVHVAPEHRHVGMVFQDWALFPHLSVADNVAYGLPRAERRGGRVDDALALVGLAGLGERSPSALSGGQQQRVALARAIAPRPRALLFDEPFSNLDTALRVQVRTEVHLLLAELGITAVFVTHDQEEAFVLGDRLAVMHEGRIEQVGTPAAVYQEPATRWVAGFVGDADLIPVQAEGSVATSALGPIGLRRPCHGATDALLRPEQVTTIGETASDSSGAPGTVELVEYYGHDHVSLVVLDDGLRVRSRQPGPPLVARGDRVRVSAAGTMTVAFSPA